ncbi:MAG: hypothetical protein U0414_26085 [Polyangiaceae bacterium]
MSGDCVVTATERVGQEVVRECVDALVEELSAWAFQREKVLAKLDLRGARRARKAASALRMLHYVLEDGAAFEDAVATILGECHALLESTGEAEAGAAPTSQPPPEQSGRRSLDGVVRLNEDDELDDIDKTAPGLPRGVLENYLAEVKRAAVG